MSRPRTRPKAPVDCNCVRAQHRHGTRSMYQQHSCGCDPCYFAYNNRRDPAERPAPAAETGGLFVATFPYDGGFSQERLARALRPEVARLAAAQAVRLLPGDIRVRFDRTGAGTFVVAAIPAVSDRPAAEVRSRAAEFAYEHEQAHPELARWVSKHLEEAAA